jgi:hypothetical protein
VSGGMKTPGWRIVRTIDRRAISHTWCGTTIKTRPLAL